MDERQRRIGRNEALFRDVNERMESLNQAFSAVTDSVVVVCECGDRSCVEQFRMSVEDYKAVRADPLLFVVRPGHAVADVEYVVDRRGDYDVMRKREDRGISEIAEKTAPRAAG